MDNSTASKTFPLGRVLITANAQEELESREVTDALRRHARGDWGELCPDDAKQNELALREGDRLFSVYRDRREIKFYIVTEADRSATTVLLAEDY